MLGLIQFRGFIVQSDRVTDSDVKQLNYALKRKGGEYNQHLADWIDAENVDKNL